jgi:hypothetical protein
MAITDTQIRTVDFLPEIFQTPVNKQFLAATLDQLVQEPRFKQTQGFIGQKVGPGVNANDKYVIEPTTIRDDYQLEPGVVQVDPADSHRIIDAITYPGITDALNVQGAITTDPQSLYTSDYYTWDPFVDFDKFVNYAQYYWVPAGPLAVDVQGLTIPTTDNFVVTKQNNTYYFSNKVGSNPSLTLVRGGTYTFDIAQQTTETINYRVTNAGTSSWQIDYQPNPTLTLIRGNTYTFDLTQTLPLEFWIKTELSFGTTNIYNPTLPNGSQAIFNNGAAGGLITFTVPQDAPDVLYYCNPTQFNLRGQFDIVDATPGTGSEFWIQTDPGVNGRVPVTPNINSRLGVEQGVTNNGTDLGTVTFDVPLSTAQNFYYNLTVLPFPPPNNNGTVDLITNLNFDQINNVAVDQFIATYGGIDGITNLVGRTLVFQPTLAGWDFNMLPVGFDSDPYAYTDPITDPAIQYSVWQINYVDVGGTLYIQLDSVQPIPDLNKFAILFGTEYSSTQWYKDASGVIQEIPLLTATKSLLFYQDGSNSEIFGQIRLIDSTMSSMIDVDNIIGHANYTSPNGVTFTNGLKVTFRGDVTPASYQNQTYYVEGVGTAIELLPMGNFVTPEAYTQSATIPYSSTPYDSENFDGTLNAPLVPDYLTINRAALDRDPWSRSNRWFHTDVINASAAYNNATPLLDNNFRAKRPILEFRAGTKLFDFGTEGIQPVNIVDLTETDAMSNVNGSTGYSTDGYTLLNGSTIIFAADLDLTVRRTVYQVQFITPDTVPPLIAEPIILLTPIAENPVLINQSVVSLDGNTQQGISYRWDGVEWIKTQQKTQVNQPPLFDIYDSNGISFGDLATYPSTNFKGSPLFSYAIGDAAPDIVLGFPLTYLSLTNVGDIVFDNNFYADSFTYTIDQAGQTVPLSSGFVRQYDDRVNFVREIGWQTAVTPSLIRQQFQFTYNGLPLLLDIAVNENTVVPAVQIFINATFQESYNYRVTTTANTTTINLLTTYVPGDLIEVLVLSDQTSATAFYEVPINLENNPFNGNSKQFTLGTIRNHYTTIAENLIQLSGPVIGANNTRDLGNIVPYGLQILQQSSPLTLTGYFMRDANYDIFGALDYNSREYIKFKSLLLQTVTTFDISVYNTQTAAQLLDAAISQINLGDTNISPFYWSDMLPTGPRYTSTTTIVNAITTPVFNTTQTYSFTESNYQGLLVYINNALLTQNYDYVVSVDSPVLTITVPLNVGDVVTINEYANTTGNFVPNTPTKLGLYPKYKPEIFYNTDYVNPTLVIQGHDGSITVAFGDIRDQVLLEFEKRIFNNLKNNNNPPPLTAEDVIPGFFRTTDYTQAEINQILGETFLSWVGYNKLDYTAQTFIADNPYTYNYSQASNKIDNTSLLGAWRGIYRYFYDTLTPNLTPWEMLGLSEMPDWWENRYGPTPYTSDNLVLWGDLELGLVANPIAPYIKPNYARPGLTSVIPVDSQGQLISPLESVVGQYNPNAFVKSWVVGDGGPVEASWWSSSSYPFAVMRLLVLTRPAEFFSLFADRDLYRYNAEFDQYLYNGRYRIDPAVIQVYGNGVSKASYINWIVDYNQQLGLNSTDSLTTDLANLDVRLCYRAASFIAQQNLNVYLEKSNPNSQNSSLLIPPESYNLVLYKNQPFDEITYSSVIVEVTDAGYTVYGYSSYQPYFPILSSKINGNTQTLTGGNISVTVPSQYSEDIVQIPYGYTFSNLTSTVDFILSYGAYLVSQGMSFTQMENGYVLNWGQMAQEFLYFANQGWASGTIINLNPAATQVSAFRPGSIVDSVVEYTPENMLLDQNRQKFESRNLIIQREGDAFSVRPAPGGSQTISFLQLRFTDYEDMIVFDNTTIFNDLMYDPITAERQSRLMMKAATSTQWNGTLNAQGFILNQNNVVAWRPNTKYTKGDIVIYKNSYWQAATIIQPTTKFEYANWYKSNYDLIEQGLLQNIALKADQLANSYDVQTANLNRDNDLLAFGLIGFRPRQYMVDLNLDSVSQVNLYQQFIKTKGSLQATDLFTQVDFNKETGQYNIYEDWGILVGTYGANANRSWFEVNLNEALLTGNPSTVQIVVPGETTQANQAILLSNLWAESYAIPTTDLLTTTYSKNLDTALPSAGYVNIDDVDITVFNLNNPSSIAANLSTIGNGTSIWVAQDNSYSWNIYQCVQVTGRMIQLIDNLNGTSIAQFSGLTTALSVGDLIIVRYFDSSVDGVYRVLSLPSVNSAVIEFSFTNLNKTLITGTGIVFRLQTMRVAQASDVINLPYVNQLVPGAMAWVDNNGSGHWEVIQKENPFSEFEVITASTLETDSLFGTSIDQSSNQYSLLVGSPGSNSGEGAVYTFRRTSTPQKYVNNSELTLLATDVIGYGNALHFGGQAWAVAGASASNSGAGYAATIYQIPASNDFIQTHLLVAPDQDFNTIGFGSAVVMSSDERWMYISAPGGNKVYAYGKVDIPVEIITYTGNGSTTSFEYSSAITINSSYPLQLSVIIDNTPQIYNVNYTIDSNEIQFTIPPTEDAKIIIARQDIVRLDFNIYYNVIQNITTGIGSGATFTVTNTRGDYFPTLTAAGINYVVGNTLTVNYTQIDPAGSSANNMVITVTEVDGNGGITEFTFTGSGISNTAVFSLETYLYTATDIDSFTIRVNSVIQRPYIDYTFSGTTVTFITVPPPGAVIYVNAETYWKYIDSITVSGLDAGANFGASIACNTDGRQILIGADRDTATDSNGNTVSHGGSVYAFDRSIVRYIITDTTQTTYAIPGTYTDPIAVVLNNQFLTNTDQYINGQFTVDAGNSTIVLSSSVVLTGGDMLEIETNQFQQVQKIVENTVVDESAFGRAVDICSNNCSVYIGAPLEGLLVPQSGLVERQVNQSRIYGVTTSTVANPTLTPGDTIRINDSEVVVPNSPNNNVAGVIAAINNNNSLSISSVTGNGTTATLTFAARTIAPYSVGQTITVSGVPTPPGSGFNGTYLVTACTTTTVSYNNSVVATPSALTHSQATVSNSLIPNVIALATPDVQLVGNGTTQIFDIGNIYSSASAYTTIVYLDSVLQISGVDYTYSNSTQQISFVDAPLAGSIIKVISGKITISVINAAAATEYNMLTVLPGTSGTAFTDLGFTTYAYTQTITSPNPTAYAQFGSSLNIDTGAVNLVVGAPNGNVYEPTTFDAGKTYFDARSTTFFNQVNNSGVVYTFDYLPSSGDSLLNPGKFVFGQQIYVDGIATDNAFGAAVNYRNGRLLVGAPDSNNYGEVAIFDNPTSSPAWAVIHTQQPAVDVNLINSVYSFDKLLNSTQTYFDFIDPLQGKILGVARKNINYIGAVDPANYNAGNIHNIGASWGPAHVGEIWWDTNTVRFIDPSQDDIIYASRRWSQTFPGSSVDIYQWIESSVSPVNYTGPGIPFSISSYTTASSLNNSGIIVTNYYFWATGITTINTTAGKTLSTTGISNYISNPLNSGLPYIAALNTNTVALYNTKGLLSASDTILHIEYDRQIQGSNSDVHTEYAFIADGRLDSFLNANLYRKLLDSFSGQDTVGNSVPDPMLSPGMQYGVQFRPRQSMFVDRLTALQNYLERANTILAQYPISETRNFNLLNSSEPTPAANSGAWDFEVPNLEILSYQDLAAVPVGYLYLVLSDSSQHGLWTIYEVAEGLVSGTKVLNLVRVQNYDTALYWNYINWYLPGYNSSIQPLVTVANTAELQTLSIIQIPIGASVKVTSNGRGKYEIYLRTGINAVTGWQRVGLEDGTIEFKEKLWNYAVGMFGFDVEVFDAQHFDQYPAIETRQIIRAINEELFVDDLLIERNQSLILMFKFIYSEFTNPYWLIKTSFIEVDHVIRGLEPFQLYQPDNQTFVLDYLQEVKPYHVQNLAFNLIYDGLDTWPGLPTDYDVPAYWNSTLEIPQFVSPVLTPYNSAGSLVESTTSDAASNAQIWLERPWSDWFNNYLLSIQEVSVVASGSGYTTTPTVTVTGTCITPAQMTAVINTAGQVTTINILDPGSGYSTTAVITLTGGGGSGAIAVAQMGNALVRSIKTTIKYDRYQYVSTILEWVPGVTYQADTQVRWLNLVWQANSTITNTPITLLATGTANSNTITVSSTAGLSTGMIVTGLGIQPDTVIVAFTNTTITLSRVLVVTLNGNETVTFYLPFDPAQWTRVSANTLSGVDRTMGYYVPGANMPGLSLPLLIDGVDYPGVQVTAPLFSQNDGFDVGNYDMNPFDSYSIDAVGRPTYDFGILDAAYSSSYLDPYLGTRATDINVDGGAYIDMFSSHAPEELIPGSEFDTLDMRVYTTPGSDWTGRGHGFQAASRRYTYDPLNPVLNFQGILEFPMVILLFNATSGLPVEPITYNWANYELTVDSTTSTPGDTLVIYTTATGGGNQLISATYLGSEMNNGNEIIIPFPTSNSSTPPVDSIYEFVIYNGETLLYNGIDYTYAASGENNTLITFTNTYDSTNRINLTALGYAYSGTTHSWSLPVFETLISDGSTTIPLTNSLQGTNPVNLIVTVNGVQARPYEGARYISNGSQLTYELPTRGGYSQSLVAENDVFVYVDQQSLILGVDFVLDPYVDSLTPRTVTLLGTAPAVDSIVLISVRTAAQYWVNASEHTLTFRAVEGLQPSVGEIIEIISWNDTSEQGILTQVFVGPETTGTTVSEGYDSVDFDSATVNDTSGSFNYTIGTTSQANIFNTGRVINNPERLLVTLNGNWLFNGLGYIVNGSSVVILGPTIPTNSVLVITSFTEFVVPNAMAFRIFQDMRGVQATYRITPSTTTTTTQAVEIDNDIIYVADANALIEPNLDSNVWGVLTIDAERIMYRYRDTITNTVSGLLRGTAGTAVAPHNSGAIVYNMGRGNLLPEDYQNYIVSGTTLADGENITFTATDIVTTDDTAIEVYVGGIRVQTGFTITNNTPVTVVFDTAPPAGADVTILVRRGVTWYAPGAGTPSNGVPLQETETVAARFLRGL